MRTHQTHRRELLQTLEDLRGRLGAHEPDCVCDFFEDLSEPNRFLWTEWWARPDLVDEAMESSRFHTLLGAIKVLGSLEGVRRLDRSGCPADQHHKESN